MDDKQKMREILNHSLSGLKENPFLAQRVIACGKTKRKIPLGVKILLALLIMTTAAIAAPNWTGMAAFLENIVGGWRVNQSAIVEPEILSNSSRWLSVAATEAYWSEDGLSVVLKVDAAAPDQMVCYENEDGVLDENGELKELITLSGKPVDAGKELMISDYAIDEGWTWYSRGEEGLFIIVNISKPDPEALQKGTQITLAVHCTNLHTGEEEWSSLVIALPPMTLQEGRGIA